MKPLPTSHEVGDLVSLAAKTQAWLEAGGGSTDGALDRWDCARLCNLRRHCAFLSAGRQAFRAVSM